MTAACLLLARRYLSACLSRTVTHRVAGQWRTRPGLSFELDYFLDAECSWPSATKRKERRNLSACYRPHCQHPACRFAGDSCVVKEKGDQERGIDAGRGTPSTSTMSKGSSSKSANAPAPYPFWLGGAAACVAACFTHPLDVTKTRMQTAKTRQGLMGSFLGAVKSGGLSNLYTGLSASLLRQMTYSVTRWV